MSIGKPASTRTSTAHHLRPGTQSMRDQLTRPTIGYAMTEQERPLRRGWTTGACATGAAKSAFHALLTGEFLDPVTITLPRGQQPSFAMAVARRDAGAATVGVPSSGPLRGAHTG